MNRRQFGPLLRHLRAGGSSILGSTLNLESPRGQALANRPHGIICITTCPVEEGATMSRTNRHSGRGTATLVSETPLTAAAQAQAPSPPEAWCHDEQTHVDAIGCNGGTNARPNTDATASALQQRLD
jgi:hypothetical protein